MITEYSECNVCHHQMSKYAFDIFPKGKLKSHPCELSCMICFNEVTEMLKAK